MHPNPAFRGSPRAENIAFAREQGFGILAVATDGAPLISHIPFLLSDDGNMAEFHLVRSNPIARLLASPLQARLAVQGPHGYISPDWYGITDQVPTWNYVAVHLVGEVTQRPTAELRSLLDRQSADFEHRLRPKPPWTTDKMTPEILDRMMRQIVPCRMQISEVAGTWKLNQNKAEAIRQSAADHLSDAGTGMEIQRLSTLMRAASPPE